MRKILNIMVIIMFIMFLIPLVSNADTQVLESSSTVDKMMGLSNGANLDNIENPIIRFFGVAISVLQVFGIAVGVIMITVMGIKYMLVSVDQRAEIKKNLVYFVLGMVIFICATQLIKILQNFISKSFDFNN